MSRFILPVAAALLFCSTGLVSAQSNEANPILAAPLVLAAASDIPTLNVAPSCHAIADKDSAIRRDFGSCMQAEQRARTDVEREWVQFTPAAKSHCTELSTLGGVPSYTELLTCLEMERDAAQLKRGAASTTGSGAGSMDTPATGMPSNATPAKP